jgi:hypothetical protein
MRNFRIPAVCRRALQDHAEIQAAADRAAELAKAEEQWLALTSQVEEADAAE